MRIRLLTFTLLLAVSACNRSGDSQPATTTSAATAAPSIAASDYHSPVELSALGLRSIPIDAEHTLLCGGDSDTDCVCLESLPCAAGGNCANFDENLKTFRDALAQPTDGRTVTCRRGETGRCDAFRSFDFNGDLDRHEMRWFDASGNLVAQRNWTDYPAYCDGRARVRFQGRVPKCQNAVREELICGEQGGAVFTPLEDLLRRAGKTPTQ